MSYSKLSKEIERYYKSNNLSSQYNALTATEEEKAERLERYNQVRDIIVQKWIEEKKYKELISCAHGRWFPYDEFTKPLAKFFIKENMISELKFLCEKEIRFKIEDLIKTKERIYEYFPNLTIDKILSFDIENYQKSSEFNPIGEAMKWRSNSLKLIDEYIGLLKIINEREYLEMIMKLREKIVDLSIKKVDLKQIKNRI